MHYCLQVNEILDLILSDLFESKPGRQSKHNLVSAALTCHDFLEVALDILWKTQTSLVPLIKTLPHDRWKEEGSGFGRTFVSNVYHLILTCLSLPGAKLHDH